MTVRMRTHRPHTKSRNGCITCKARKVKCDERVPCTNCELRSTPCFYQKGCSQVVESITSSEASEEESLPSPGALNRASSSTIPLFDFFTALPRAPLCNTSGFADSFLVSEYCKHSSVGIATASGTDRRLEIYCEVIPSLGFRHPVVSEAILALAPLSLCIAQLRKLSSSRKALSKSDFDNLTRPFLHQAHIHHAKALRLLQGMVISLCKQNTDAVLACSVLLIPYELAHSQLIRHRERLSDEGWRNPGHGKTPEPLDLTWIHLCRGLTTVMATSLKRSLLIESRMLPLFQWIRSDGIYEGPFVPFTPIPKSRFWTPHNEAKTVLSHPLLDTVLISGLDALDKLQQQFQTLLDTSSDFNTSQTLNTCLSALFTLQGSLQNFTASALTARSQPFFRILIEWIPTTSADFFDLLARQNKLALAVYAHFAVYMTLLEDTWFIGDLGVDTLRRISLLERSGSSSGRDVEYTEEMLAWPRMMLRLYDDGF